MLAAAAAVLLMLQRPTEPSSTVDTTTARAEGLSYEPSGWALDTSLGDEAAILASIRVDGNTVASMEDFDRQIAGANRVESVTTDVRIRYRDEFVMELAADTAVGLDAWSDSASEGGERVLFAESGSLRMATGPGFDPAFSLAVETPHVRTEVVGTIFGLDIGADYTCVCCLEGTIRTQQLMEGVEASSLSAGRTWVAKAGKESLWQIPLVSTHHAPLLGLEGYWA